MNKLIFALLVACVCMQTAVAEQVSNWFRGYAEGAAAQGDNGTWTVPGSGVSIADGRFSIDLDGNSVLSFNPAADKAPDTNVVARIVSEVAFVSSGATIPTVPEEAKTAFIVSNGIYSAYIVDKWVALTGDDPESEDTLVKVLTEMDYCRNVPKVRFAIIDDSKTNFLHSTSQSQGDWFTLTGKETPSSGLVASVSYGGMGIVKDLDGKVQLGVALYDDVKYPTVQGAVDAAGTAENAQVKVLRDNNETVTIAENQKIKLDTNGKECGAIVNNNPTVPVEIGVDIPAATVAQGSGTYEVEASITGKATLTVTTSDTSKEAAGEVIEGGTKIRVKVQTAASVMDAVQFDGKAVAPAATTAYRTFLETYCGAKDGAYMKANTTAEAIALQLGANGSNGLPLWESYVLDLKPNDATSKPAAVVKPAMESTGNMVLSVPTYKATLPESNYTVKYMLETIDGSSSEIDNPAQITIPFDGNRYRVNTVIVPKTQN